MILSSENLNKLRVGYNAAMKRGLLSTAAATSSRIAMRVAATQQEQRYGWLGKLPDVREWIGDRVIQNISESDYAIKEKAWELTVGVGRDDIETDQLGHYSLLFEAMGESTISKPEQLVWGLLKAGFATNCYDGQFFFDTDHPVLDANGVSQSVANTDGGSGTGWYLLDVSRVIKPLILQVRRDFGEIVAKDRVTDDNVFDRNEYVYGVDARMNVGYGFWQFAWGSKQTLSETTYALGRSSLMGMKGDYGRPLGIMPKLLVVPPSLEGVARSIVASQLKSGGETNPWAGTAEVLVVPWLA